MGALENPPLLVVSDTKLIRIHTNFTNRAKKTIEIPLAQIGRPGAGSAVATPTFCATFSFRYTDVPAGNAEKSMTTSKR